MHREPPSLLDMLIAKTKNKRLTKLKAETLAHLINIFPDKQVEELNTWVQDTIEEKNISSAVLETLVRLKYLDGKQAAVIIHRVLKRIKEICFQKSWTN